MTVEELRRCPHGTVPLWPEAGQALGVSRYMAYKLAGEGRFPGLLTFGGRYRVAVAGLLRVLEGEAAA